MYYEEYQYRRDLQEWLRCIRICSNCKLSKRLTRYPRSMANDSICYDCLDKSKHMSNWISNKRNYARTNRSNNFEKRFILSLVR